MKEQGSFGFLPIITICPPQIAMINHCFAVKFPTVISMQYSELAGKFSEPTAKKMSLAGIVLSKPGIGLPLRGCVLSKHGMGMLYNGIDIVFRKTRAAVDIPAVKLSPFARIGRSSRMFNRQMTE